MRRRHIQILILLCWCVQRIAAQPPELLPDQEYDITLDNGETLRQGKVRLLDEKTAVFEIDGVRAPVKVPRGAIVKAVPRIRAKLFSGYELRILGGFDLALGDLKLLSKYFPQGSIGFSAWFSRRIPYLGISSLSAELQYAHITDGERLFSSTALIVAPQWRFELMKINWFVGAGGGISGLYLLSYNFTRFRPNAYAMAEFGAAQKVGKKIRLYIVSRVSWWPDTAGALVSMGGSVGFSYEW